MLKLRDYQTEALARVKDAYKDGKRRVLVSLPTGTGKTVVFAHFPTALRMKKRLLVLAHREELLTQAEQKFRAVDPDLKIGIERAEERAASDTQVVIASVQTLARSQGARLSRFNPDDFSIIVVDEAHHAVAESYRRIFNHFGLFKPETSRYLVGLYGHSPAWRQAGAGRSISGGLLCAGPPPDDRTGVPLPHPGMARGHESIAR